jgi:hypothetical protein
MPLYNFLRNLLNVQAGTTDDECVAIGGTRKKEKSSKKREPAPVTLCPPQIPYDISRALVWAAVVLPSLLVTISIIFSHVWVFLVYLSF